MANPTIIIDAGHGGYDNGASDNGRLEKDDNLRLALAVGEILTADGFPVVYTRTEDVYQRPIDKAGIANESGGDYFVSFHRNASPERNTYSGVQTLVYSDEGIKAELARRINEELGKLGFNDLGVQERINLVVLRRTRMPAVLIETGFINTDADNELFDARFDEIAYAIARAIEETVQS
jgi:N-acetylmuramoyl-L-alanine amidase